MKSGYRIRVVPALPLLPDGRSFPKVDANDAKDTPKDDPKDEDEDQDCGDRSVMASTGRSSVCMWPHNC